MSWKLLFIFMTGWITAMYMFSQTLVIMSNYADAKNWPFSGEWVVFGGLGLGFVICIAFMAGQKEPWDEFWIKKNGDDSSDEV